MPFEIPTIDIYYVNVFVLIQFSLKTSVLSQLLSNLHKIIGRRCDRGVIANVICLVLIFTSKAEF